MPASAPSMMTRGADSFKVPCPRTVIVALSLPGWLLPLITLTPAATPAKACDTLVMGRLSVSSPTFTEETDPDMFTFF